MFYSGTEYAKMGLKPQIEVKHFYKYRLLSLLLVTHKNLVAKSLWLKTPRTLLVKYAEIKRLLT